MQVGYRPPMRMPMGMGMNIPPPSIPPPPMGSMPPLSIPPPPIGVMPPPQFMNAHHPQQSLPPPQQQQQYHQHQQSQYPYQGGPNNMSQMGPMMMMPSDGGFDGKMLRKTIARKTVDYNPSCVRYLEDRIWKKDQRDERSLQPDPLYAQLMTLPQGMMDNPVNCVMTKFIRAALNKDPRPIFCVCWTPDGRRLITGASSGEFTLWNGLTFNFETILQAHNSSVRTMIWSRNEQWMITGDDKGYVKYWQANMNNVKMIQGHLEAIRGLRTVRIFDFVTSTEESVLHGHGSDVKCVDWHPFKSLIISGSKDSQQPIILWDPRTKKKITTLHAHKNTCTDLKWNQFNGNWLVSSSRDHLCKLFDIRNLKEEVQSFRGHKKEVNTVSWHPIYERMFASGGADGSLYYWQVGAEKELGSVDEAHENMIWDLSWHPLGHMLVSGSNDRSTRFWTRNRPGDTILDKTDELQLPRLERATGIIFKNIDLQTAETTDKQQSEIALPGLGLEKEILDSMNDEFKDDTSTGQQQQPSAASTAPNLYSPGQRNYQQPPPSMQQFNPSMQPPPQQQQQQHQQQHQQTQYHNHMQNQQSGEKREHSSVQSSDYDDEESRKKRGMYTKPIPRDFEKAWSSNMPMPLNQQQQQYQQQQHHQSHKAPLLQLPNQNSKRSYDN